MSALRIGVAVMEGSRFISGQPSTSSKYSCTIYSDQVCRAIFVEQNPELNVLSGFTENNSDDYDNNFFNLGLGVSAVFPKGHSCFLNFESRLGDSTLKDNSINLVIGMSFDQTLKLM